MLIVQVEVIIPMDTPLQGVVEGSIHMVSFSVYCKYIPGVTVAHSLFRVCLAEGDDTLYSRRITQCLHRFSDALAHTHPLGQRADDLVGIRFFQLIIANAVQYEIVNGNFLFQLALSPQGPGKPLYSGRYCLLVGASLSLVKQVFRQQLHMLCPGIKPIAIPRHMKQQRCIQL